MSRRLQRPGAILASLWLLLASAAPAALAETILPDPTEGYHWEMIWEDEFEGTALDGTKWSNFHYGDGRRRDGWWTADAVSLDGDGHLVMSCYEEDGEYYSGAIRTKDKFEHSFGFYTASIQLQEQQGHWSAFWVFDHCVGNVDGSGQDGTEIDIMEKASLDDSVHHALHWDGYGDEHQSVGTDVMVPGVMDGFHEFSLWWKPDEYVFYVDGEETWRTSAGGVSQVEEYLKLTDEVGTWAGDIGLATLPDTWYVDYVRVYDLLPGAVPEPSCLALLAGPLAAVYAYLKRRR
jgi:beta-glucanase (GH16 family)